MSNMIAFNDNYADNSTDAGFAFTFFCDKCGEGYKTRFIASKTYKKKGLFDNIGKLASAAGAIAGNHTLGTAGRTGSAKSPGGRSSRRVKPLGIIRKKEAER